MGAADSGGRRAGTPAVLAHTSGPPERWQVCLEKNITLKTDAQCNQQNALKIKIVAL